MPPTEVNNLPTIEADDKVLAVDAPSNPLEDVIAYDTEDGTLIEQIIVTNNTADKSQPGKYEVTYQVTDVKGAFTAKTKMDSDTTTIEKDRTDTKKYDVKTNKQKNMVMRIIILAAVVLIIYIAVYLIYSHFIKKRAARHYDEVRARVLIYDKHLEELEMLYKVEENEDVSPTIAPEEDEDGKIIDI